MNEEKKIIQLDDVTPKSSKEKKKRNLLILILVLLLIVAVAGWFWYKGQENLFSIRDYSTAQVRKGKFVSTTEASGTVVLPTQVEIGSPEDGYTLSLLVEEGAQVTPEDVLAELEVEDLQDSLSELTVELEQARIERENLENTYYYQIAQLKRDLARLDTDISEADEDVQTMKELVELKSSRQSDYEDALDSLNALQEELEDTKAELDAAVLTRDIALRKQQAVIHQLEVNLAIVKDDLEDTRIKSPIAGEVLEINEDLFIAGSQIEQGDSLFTVADRSDVYIDFDVYEQYVSFLEPGGEMTVTVGTNTMEAEIIKIGKIATMDTDGLAAMISVRARPLTDQTLTPGASAAATIPLSVQEDVLLLPRGAWLTTGGQKYVYTIRDGKAYKTEVVLGEIQGSDVEILSGLKAGDTVLKGSYQTFIDQPVVVLK